MIQVTPQGLLIQTISYRDAANDDYQITGRYNTSPGPWEKVNGLVIMAVGCPKASQLSDGQTTGFYGYQDGTVTYNGTDGAIHTVQRWVYVSDEAPKK